MKQFLFTFPAIFFLAACSPDENPDKADLILVNGKVWTGNPSVFEEAIAIRDSEILRVGTTAEIKKLANKNTKVVDAEGRLVTPGFNDAHIHFLNGSIGLSEVELSSAESLNEILGRINSFANDNPERLWITGRGWQYTMFPGGMPTKEFLDTLKIDRPIYLRAYDGHSALTNSKTLELAGINRSTRFTGFGEIIRNSKGEPTGALIEHAQNLVAKIIPPLSREDKLNALRKGMQLAASLGITSIQNASGSVDEFSLYEELLNKGELALRSSTAFSVGEQTTPEDIKSYEEIRDKFREHPILRTGAVKFMLDGVIESHTAAMIRPYSDVPEKGNLSMPLERYRELVRAFDQSGFQIYTHAIGDLAVREALNAYEYAMAVNGTSGRRHRVEHIEMVDSEDIPRFNKLGVLASMQPIHAVPGTDAETASVWEKAVGEARLPNSFAWAAFLNNKATLVFSSDWPACLSLDPIYGLHVAVTRCASNGQPPGGWVPKQKISVQDALYAYTEGRSLASFEEDRKGKIAPGFLADIIVHSQDLFTIDPLKIADTKIVLTIFDGKIIYQDSTAFND